MWILHVALPALVLWLLIARPQVDLRWEHHVAHFWLVLGTALVNVALGAQMARAAGRRDDARLFLVALAFLVSAAFLGLHALATPGVLLEVSNAGFVIATPVGLFIGGVLALASSVEWSPTGAARVRRLQRPIAVGLAAVIAVWAVSSLAQVPPLDQSLPPEEARGPLVAMAFGGTGLYGLGYLGVHRRRPAVVLVSLVTAFVLLAQAMFAVAYGRNWQASWWEWHILMTVAFAFVAYSAFVQFRREGSARGLFNAITLEHTVAAIQRDHRAALEELVETMERGAGDGATGVLGPVAARLADRFDLTEQQVAVLERGAEALADEREQTRRLGALVAVGEEASVIQTEERLLGRVLELTRNAFRREDLALGLVQAGKLTFTGRSGAAPAELYGKAMTSLEPVESPDGRVLVLPLQVKDQAAGVLEAVSHRDSGFRESDRALLRSFASQLSIAMENARLYGQLEGLARTCRPPLRPRSSPIPPKPAWVAPSPT